MPGTLPEIPTDRTYLRLRQREELERQQAGIERQLSNPSNEDTGSLRRRLAHTKQALAEGSPPELTGDDLECARREERRLEDKIRQGMLSHEEMFRNPGRSVSKHDRWKRENLLDAFRLKNIKLITHRNDDSDDVCDLEYLRPPGGSVSLEGAQIGRKAAYFDAPQSAAYRENFDRTFGPDGETLEQRRARLAAEIEATDEALAAQEAAQLEALREPKAPRAASKAAAAG